MEMLDWEEIVLPAGKLPGVGSRTRYLRVFRAVVPGGWLVLAVGEQMGVHPSITFYPDPEYRWADEARAELEAAEAPAGQGTELVAAE